MVADVETTGKPPVSCLGTVTLVLTPVTFPPLAIEGVAGHAHDLAGPGYVAELLSQIQQTCFVFNDGIVSMQHESYLFCFD